jgi:hypothetical protein
MLSFNISHPDLLKSPYFMDKIDLILKEGFQVKPCALNAEFQHFIFRFHHLMDNSELRLKEGFGGERMPKGRVTTG